MNEPVNGNYPKKPRRILGTKHQEQLENVKETNDSTGIAVSKNPKSSVAVNLVTNTTMDSICCRSYWPLGQFIAPVCTAGLPIFPASVPFFPYYQPSTFGSNFENYQPLYTQTSTSNSRSPESNMTIQIGLQCLNQNNPVNINTYNMPMSSPKFSKQQIGLPITTSDLAVAQYNGYATMNGTNAKYNAKTITARDLSEERIAVLISIAKQGCEIAERLSNDYRNRPCFKKIDSLCVRTKNDLSRPDGVIANINSQGTAWAIKDFIFVFTRIINAWIIIKGYTSNNNQGLENIKTALSTDFIRSFAVWQSATIDFVENIIKSFVSLNTLVQSQMQKHGCNNSATNNTPSPTCSGGDDESMNNLFNESNINDNSDIITKDTLNEYYMKTGSYGVWKEGKPTDSISLTDDNTSLAKDNHFPVTLPSKVSIHIPFNGEGDGGGCSVKNVQHDCKSNHDPMIDNNFVSDEQQSFLDPIMYKAISKDLNEKLEYLLRRISNISAGQYFFTAKFTKNYFPDFTSKFPNFMDLRSIITKAQVGGYSHIYEIVHDLKLIVFNAKIYILNTRNELLRKSIIEYENEINNILLKTNFQCWSFNHITGDPNENLYIDQNNNNNKVKNLKECKAEDKNIVYSSIKLQKK